MNADGFRKRTQAYALRIVRLVETMPRSGASLPLSDQLQRAGTSVAANYRAACRAKSRPDFISKLRIVEEEADEVLYWLELLADAGVVDRSIATPLLAEGNEILAMTVQSIKTARSRL